MVGTEAIFIQSTNPSLCTKTERDIRSIIVGSVLIYFVMVVLLDEIILCLHELTVLDGDPALAVVYSQCRLVASSLLDHCAHCPLPIGTVIGWVLSQLQSRLVRCKNKR